MQRRYTFGIFYLHISKMLRLFEIRGQGKAQYGNFQTPSPKKTLFGASLTVVSMTIKQLGCSCTNKGAVGGSGLDSNKALVAVTGHSSVLESWGICTN